MPTKVSRRQLLKRATAASVLAGLATASTPAAVVAQEGQEAEKKDRKVLFCSTSQVADFARNVVGDRWEVISVLGAGADPHTYQPKTSDLNRVGRATLCLENGWHLEGNEWMKTLAKNAQKPLVTCVSGVEEIPLEDDEGETVRDPHAWFDPKNAWIYVRNIAEKVMELDPDHKSEYKARADLYRAQLRALDGWIKKMVNDIPEARRVLVSHHDAFGYFCKTYRFRAVSPVGWSTAEISGGTLDKRQAIVDQIKDLGVKSIFVETSTSDKTLQGIARDAGVAIGGSLYSDAMGPADSAGETYLGMMRENVLTMVEALR